MSNRPTSWPPEQEAIRDSCFQLTEMFAEFSEEAVDQSIPARFEKIVRMYPNRLAVKVMDHALTYDELNRYANRISCAILEQRGPGSEPIGLLFEHGIDAIAAIFAVLKAGKFFLALNLASPEERNARALADSGTPLVVTNARHQSLVETLGRGLVLSLNVETLGKNDPSDPVLHRPMGDIAVLTYTSGSTGEPKGVVQTHQHLLHSFRIQTDEMRITIDDRVSLLHSLSFATAYSNLLAALLNGAALFPLDMKTVAQNELITWVAGQKITAIHLPPSSFREFAESFGANVPSNQLRLIRLSGSPITELDFELYRTNFPAGTLLNVTMGSTELRGICSAILDQNYVFPPDGAPVGYARPGKQVLILDDLGREVENGQVGEIAVRSKYADGEYWQPSMRGKALIQRTGEMDEERLYLTGDLGKKLDDGFVIHLGRKDFMVKIRGYRVDFAEIERALLAHPQLIAAAVMAWDQQSEEKFLTAYVVARESNTPTVNEVRGFLREKLPDYMIPSAFMFLQSLPLTNGKLDRTALPRPDHKRPNLQQPYAPPRDDVEVKLVQIWQEILNVRPVGIHDNFFDLGGHSLLAVRLFGQIERTFGNQLRPATLFEAPTIEQLASFLKGADGAASWSALVPIQPNGANPPFFWVHGDSSSAFLPKYLDADQPIFGLEHQSQDGKPALYKKTQTIAAHYLEEIQLVQPKGPYFLGGYSFGGTVAFEIAQQLTRQNEEVALLILLDSGFPGLRDILGQRDAYSSERRINGKTLSGILRRHWQNLSPLGVKASIQYVSVRLLGRLNERTQGIRKVLRKIICSVNIALGLPIPRSLRSDYILDIYDDQARRTYVPLRYDGKVFYIKSEQRLRDHSEKWREVITGEMEIYEVPGGHSGLRQETSVGLWAGAVQARLAEAQVAVRKA